MAFGRPPGSSWAAVRRQMAGRTAPEVLLGGSLGGLGGSWGALGASLGRLGPPRRSPGGSGRLRARASGGHFGAFFGGPAPEAGKCPTLAVIDFCCFLDRVLALIFGFFLLAWHAPGGAANIDNHENSFFVGRKAFARFSRTPPRARYLEQRRAGNS